jgi:DNA-binding MarR family transcriptional regulator
MEPITLCRIVDRLEEAGLVERKPDPSDRRAWRLELTQKAGPLVNQLRVLAHDLAEDVMDGMEELELSRLRKELAAIRANIGRLAELRAKAARA